MVSSHKWQKRQEKEEKTKEEIDDKNSNLIFLENHNKIHQKLQKDNFMIKS